MSNYLIIIDQLPQAFNIFHQSQVLSEHRLQYLLLVLYHQQLRLLVELLEVQKVQVLVQQVEHCVVQLEDHYVALNKKGVPKHQARFQVEGSEEEGVNPLHPVDVPHFHFVPHHSFVESRKVVENQSLETGLYILQKALSENVRLVDQFPADDEVAEVLEGLVGSEEQEKDHHHVAHSLHVVDVWSVGDEDFEEDEGFLEYFQKVIIFGEEVEGPVDVYLQNALVDLELQGLLH